MWLTKQKHRSEIPAFSKISLLFWMVRDGTVHSTARRPHTRTQRGRSSVKKEPRRVRDDCLIESVAFLGYHLIAQQRLADDAISGNDPGELGKRERRR